jgi:Protein of unknown function (DUF2844)
VSALHQMRASIATKSNPGAAMQILAGDRNLSAYFGFKTTTRSLRTTEIGVSHMKSNSRISTSPISRMGIAFLVLSLSLPAFAALGGDVASVHEDQAQMKGTLKTTQAEAYSVHEISASANTVVKEYVSPAGKVFAITWHGQFIPDMQQLLGTYYDQYAQAAKTQRESHSGHHPVNIQQPGLVFQNGGHMRSYVGRAYVPDMVPQGVNVNALQ